MSQRTNETSRLCSDDGCLLSAQRPDLGFIHLYCPSLHPSGRLWGHLIIFPSFCRPLSHLDKALALVWLLTSSPLHHSQAGFSQNNCDHVSWFKTLQGPYQIPPMPRTLWGWRLAFLLPSTPFLLLASSLPCQPHIHFLPPTFALLPPGIPFHPHPPVELTHKAGFTLD